MIKDGSLSESDRLAAAYHMDRVLGLRLSEASAEEGKEEAGEEELRLLEERTAAKKAKDFARADAIRDELKKRGWTVKDTPSGAVLEKNV